MANERSRSANANATPGCKRRNIPSPTRRIKLRHDNGKQDATGRALVFRWGGGLGEGDEVAGRILDGEFAHAVERGAFRHDFLYILHSG